MRPANVSGIVTGDVPVSYWPISFPVLSNSPRSLCESKLRPISALNSKVANFPLFPASKLPAQIHLSNLEIWCSRYDQNCVTRNG